MEPSFGRALGRPYYPDMPLTERGRHILFVGIGIVGYVYLARVLLVEGIQGDGGLGGIDAIAYWNAAGSAIRGEPLYVIGGFGFGAYQYPPVFAQLLSPLSLLPMPAFVWLWRGLELVGLRLATGSWVRSGIAILVFPPVIAEIDAGNVHLMMAGVAALAMRGLAGPVAPALLVKFSTYSRPMLFRPRAGAAISTSCPCIPSPSRDTRSCSRSRSPSASPPPRSWVSRPSGGSAWRPSRSPWPIRSFGSTH